jgi:sugar lactone lactonase YvrE
MIRLPRALPLALFVLAALAAPAADAWTRTPAATFVTLPADAAHPEGITADRHGNIYVTTFAVGGTSSGLGQLFVFDDDGRLRRRVNIAGSSTLLLDLAFHPTTGDLLVIDFGHQQVLRVHPVTGASSVFTTIPGGGAPIAWVTSPLLATTGVPPFGANGLAFNGSRTALFVANTGNDTVVRIPVSGGIPGTPAVFVNSINGADGLIIDDDDNLWVAANQADEIVVVDPTGRVIAKLGDFGGIDDRGAPIGLLFPASLVRSGQDIYVTNLALDLRLFGLAQPVDAQWAAQVTRHTIARIPARIPKVPGLP